MKVILFGATGMVGQGALLECLRSPDVESVLCVGRRPTGRQHPKLREAVLADVAQVSSLGEELSGHDACLFCLGVSSAGMSERDYRRVTYDTTMAVAAALLERNAAMTFVYVSGASTDGSEQGRVMWARVKGETENALLRMPFKAAYMFRPGYIQPLDGIRASTRGIRWLYAVFGPLYPLLKRLFPRHVTTTRRLGRAMILAAAVGAEKRVLEAVDINALAPDAD
ncbi:MAG TPA: NAD(P)H-binding protein [Vicinamibacteria bacterium]|nr:NAD(P)H-binding protein [Vicinamibacteria bacterium]